MQLFARCLIQENGNKSQLMRDRTLSNPSIRVGLQSATVNQVVLVYNLRTLFSRPFLHQAPMHRQPYGAPMISNDGDVS